ncbi:MAG: hypothetical protein IIC96_16645 [Chloroflexi bacterium]|nr:hypothetical protein [Chloroflexota bacterium]
MEYLRLIVTPIELGEQVVNAGRNLPGHYAEVTLSHFVTRRPLGRREHPRTQFMVLEPNRVTLLQRGSTEAIYKEDLHIQVGIKVVQRLPVVVEE